ncbi:MAG: hypothetical protein FJ095_03570 [Deltaproteobacteria bacterium]|nr:hypothetical protein [Deltaproteobacteria bacterium]
MAVRPALVLALLIAAACKRSDAPPREILPVPVGSFRVDSVPEGTLAEGKVEAFGLKLPRGMSLDGSFPDAVFASGGFSLESVSNYMRERVEAERVETTPKKTVFRSAKLGGQGRVLHIEVSARSTNIVEVVVRDETPRPATQGLTEEERWKQVGLTPEGKVLPEQNQ